MSEHLNKQRFTELCFETKSCVFQFCKMVKIICLLNFHYVRINLILPFAYFELLLGFREYYTYIILKMYAMYVTQCSVRNWDYKNTHIKIY